MKFHMLDLDIFIVRPAVSDYQLSAVMVLQSFEVNNKLYIYWISHLIRVSVSLYEFSYIGNCKQNLRSVILPFAIYVHLC